MPCHAVTDKSVETLSPDTTVKKALALLKKKSLPYVSVLNKDGTLEGLFSYKSLFKNILPVSVAMADGIQLDITIHAAPGLAKRLAKAEGLPVSDFVNRKVPIVHPETPIWEGVNLLVQHGAPLVVVEKETQKFIGLMTGESALDELQRLKESEA